MSSVLSLDISPIVLPQEEEKPKPKVNQVDVNNAIEWHKWCLMIFWSICGAIFVILAIITLFVALDALSANSTGALLGIVCMWLIFGLVGLVTGLVLALITQVTFVWYPFKWDFLTTFPPTVEKLELDCVEIITPTPTQNQYRR